MGRVVGRMRPAMNIVRMARDHHASLLAMNSHNIVRLARALPREAPPRRCLSTAAAAVEKDTRPWFIRNWGTSLFLSVVSTWGYTLWISNKARKASDAAEENVKGRMPANADELLELRALNDAPADAIASLPKRAARAGLHGRASGPQMLALLREAIAPPRTAPEPLKEEYVLERIMMALYQEDETRTADVALATSALA